MCGHTSAWTPRQIALCGHTAASAERSDSAAELRGRKRPRPQAEGGNHTKTLSAREPTGPHCPPLSGDAKQSAAPLPAVRRGLWTPGALRGHGGPQAWGRSRWTWAGACPATISAPHTSETGVWLQLMLDLGSQ